MMYNTEFREEAQRDLIEAYRWYEKKQNGLGGKLILEVEAGLNHLKQNPKAFEEKKKGFREFNLKTFPYVMIFRLKKQNVIVYAVFHTRRNPNKKP